MNEKQIDLYLNTLRDSLTGKLNNDGATVRLPLRILSKWLGIHISKPITKSNRDEGRAWPVNAMTMVGTKRLNNLRECIESVIIDGIQGDIVECGVWRGGAAIYAAGVLEAYGDTRDVYLCDSFEGLPRPRMDEDAHDRHWLCRDYLGVGVEEVMDNIARHHLDGPNIKISKGWFRDTLKDLPTRSIAVLRADGDMYESTMDILSALEPRVVDGGYVIIDDWGVVPACRMAVLDYLDDNKLKPEIRKIDHSGIYWRKKQPTES